MRKIVLFLLLCGCATQEEINAQIDAAIEQCAGVFTPGSEAHYRCVNETLDRQSFRMPRREVTTCRPDGYGGVRCTTR